MFSIPVQTAIVSSLVGNALLAGIFLYLWRVDRNEHALGYWTSAYAASAGSVGFRMLSLAGYAQAAYGEGLLGAAVVVLLAMGARVFVGKAFAMPWRSGLLAFAVMGSVSGLAAIGLYLLSITASLEMAYGDFLVLLSAFFWSAQVLIVAWLSPRVRAVNLAFYQVAVCALLTRVGYAPTAPERQP